MNRLIEIAGIALSVALLTPAFVAADGMASSANFVVLAPDERLAEEVLAHAERYRKQIALEWLGEELPPSVGRTVIYVKITDNEDRGLFWPIDSPGRTLHSMWIRTNPERAVGSALRHEVFHLVAATRFPGRIPAWIDEGIASRYDDEQRIRTRRDIIAWYSRTGNWPPFVRMLEHSTISTKDQAAYSMAASLVEFLLTRGDRETLLQFALDGSRMEWNAALRKHYDMKDVSHLQTAWQNWADSTGIVSAKNSSAQANRFR